MVHKKSTYRLMFKNYGADVRREVWQENNSLRLRRREEEMSHHSIEETESECECDLSEEETQDQKHSKAINTIGTKGILCKSLGREENGQRSTEMEGASENTYIPRLHFSPEQTPRTLQREQVSDETANETAADMVQNEYTNQDFKKKQSVQEQLQDGFQSKRKVQSAKDKLGMMEAGTREFDLLPVKKEEVGVRPKSAPSFKVGLSRSRKYPFTTQLSRTTKRNFLERNKTTFVPSGTGCSVDRIGDKTSYNIHLNKDQVKQTALLASGLRNKEIEHLIKKQQKLTLDDWREKHKVTEPVNHSSLFADGSKNIFRSSRKPRERLVNIPSRVEIFSNYCKHCGGRK